MLHVFLSLAFYAFARICHLYDSSQHNVDESRTVFGSPHDHPKLGA